MVDLDKEPVFAIWATDMSRGLYSNIFGDEYRGNLLEDFAGVEGNYNLWKQFLLKF